MALNKMIQGALKILNIDGKFAGGVPENSAVGESQSNSRSERAVLEAEIRIRTLKHALQERIDRRIPSNHLMMLWLVQYAGVLLTKYAVHDDNTTAYQQLHGKRATERLCELGGRVLFYVPKRRRKKMDMIWTAGIYLGTTLTSNEAYVALPDGNVTRARALTRIRPDQRWRADIIEKITGTPQIPSAVADDSLLEAYADPHVHLDKEQQELLDREDGLPDTDAAPSLADATLERAPPRLRITQRLLNNYGFTHGCPRCDDLDAGKRNTNKHHSEFCRSRVYTDMKENNDPVYDELRSSSDKRPRPTSTFATATQLEPIPATTPPAQAPEAPAPPPRPSPAAKESKPEGDAKVTKAIKKAKRKAEKERKR